MLGFDTWEEMVEKNPALTEEQLALFRRRGATIHDIFSDDHLHFDFIDSFDKSRFNRAATKIFVENFTSTVQGGAYSHPPVPDRYLTDRHVREALSTYMETCRRKYREVLEPPSDKVLERRADNACKSSRKATVSIHAAVMRANS